MKLFLSLLLVVGTFLGILDASYLTYEKLSGQIPPCTTAFKCGAVLESPWANIGPIPLSVFGIGFYSTFFVISLLFYVGKTEVFIFEKQVPLKLILLVLGIFGVSFSSYLVFIMGVILQAWCLYCLASAFICVTLFITSSALYIVVQKGSNHEMRV